MPPKKANSKKASTKLAASSTDAEMLNNGEKEVIEEVAIDAKTLANGDSIYDENDTKASPKLKANKRGGGRGKNVVPHLDEEAPSGKKPVAKGRGKKKLNENEVIENEVSNSSQPETQEIDDTKVNEETKPKPKGRGGGKKAETKKVSKADSINKEPISAGDTQEEDATNQAEVKIPEKNIKTSGRKKKQEVTPKKEEQVEQKEDILDDALEEKDSKKNFRNSKKSEDTLTVAEPQKKKGRAAKKEKLAEKDDTETPVADEIKADVKEKKTTKRGRAAAAKLVPAEEEPAAVNGDAEEVLPKKRSRKAPSDEKEIVKEKPKRGRAKKSDKEDIEADPELKGKEEENATNGEDKLEQIEEIEEIKRSSKKPEIEIEPAAADAKATAKAKGGGRKRAAPSANNKKTAKTTTIANNGREEELLDDVVANKELEEDEADGSKPSKTKKSKTDAALSNSTVTKYNKEDFELPPPSDGQTAEEPRYNFKISSWNVAGLRSWVKKDGLKFLEYEQPDIFCVQETKCTNDQLPEEVSPIPGYHPYWLCMPGGYAGVAIYSKIMPINVEYGIGHKEFDDNGRIITAEYEKFFLVNVYVPNSGRKLVNLESRMKWEKLFQQFIQDLDARKPVVICGDMNVSHQEIDLANPKSNTRSAGFTKEEREKMTELLGLGFIDTYRHLYPERKGAYTYWTYMANARSRNVGWRLDYFIVAERFITRIVDNCIRSQCMGSDHCPITLFLKL